MARSTSTKETAAKDAAEASVEDISAQIEVLKSDIAALTKSIADIGIAKGEGFRQAAEERAAHLRDAGHAAADRATQSARTFASDTERKIQENPTAAIGIATGVGFLLGLILARR